MNVTTASFVTVVVWLVHPSSFGHGYILNDTWKTVSKNFIEDYLAFSAHEAACSALRNMENSPDY